MTYDPLSYGQIKLRDRAANTGDTPDDLLFEDAGPGFSEPTPHSDWAEPESESEFLSFQAGDHSGEVSQFGADVLGEAMTAPAIPSPVPTARPPVARRRLSSGAAPAAGGVGPAARAKAPAAAKSAPSKLPRRTAAERVRPPVNRPGRVMGTLMPAVVIAVGGSAAGWFYMMDQNMVMSGIVGATSLVGAALARVMFR